MDSPIFGRWKNDAGDYIQFGRLLGGLGGFEIAGYRGNIDFRLSDAEGTFVAEFSWQGWHDDKEGVSGRGHLQLEGDCLIGTLFVHRRPEIQLVLTRAGA